MRRALAILILIAFSSMGCATLPPPALIFSGKDLVEVEPLPPNPATEPLLSQSGKSYPGLETQVTGVAKGDAAPYDGICVSEARAARDGAFRSRYVELRTTVQVNNIVIAAQRKFYEDAIVRDHKIITELQPNIFEKHTLEIGVVVGVILGVGLSVATFHAVEGK